MKATDLLKICTISLTILSVEPLFKNRLKNIKNKAKQFYKSKYGKDKSWHFLGEDPSIYPGTNPKYLEINKQKWEEYYNCLEAQNNNLGEHQSVTPEAILAFEGSNIRFDCKICINPQERQGTDSIQWHWAAKDKTHLQLVEFTEHIVESPGDKALHLYNLQVEHTGQYICTLGGSLTAPYFLTVSNMTDNEMTEVHPKQASYGPYPKDPEAIERYGLILDTEFSEWSLCSRCNSVGRKHRFGYCAIHLESQRGQIMHSESTKTNKTKSDEPKKNLIKANDLQLFNVFKYGIPCKSHILPKSIRKHSQVKNRKDEIMTTFCKMRCPKNEIFEVKDKNGNVVEQANNSAGVYSLLQSLPPLEPPIERKLIYGAKGKTIVLSCPGNINSDTPLQWQIGNKNLVPELISRESKGRIFISITDRIHIGKAKISDSSIYSCWQQKELAGTIRLIVEKKFEMTFTHHIMLLGLVIVLATFLYVFLRAFLGRKYAKT